MLTLQKYLVNVQRNLLPPRRSASGPALYGTNGQSPGAGFSPPSNSNLAEILGHLLITPRPDVPKLLQKPKGPAGTGF
jgi:hypothetical protein